MSREKGDNESCRPPFRPFVEESGPRPDKSTSGSLVTKGQASVLEAAGTCV